MWFSHTGCGPANMGGGTHIHRPPSPGSHHRNCSRQPALGLIDPVCAGLHSSQRYLTYLVRIPTWLCSIQCITWPPLPEARHSCVWRTNDKPPAGSATPSALDQVPTPTPQKKAQRSSLLSPPPSLPLLWKWNPGLAYIG